MDPLNDDDDDSVSTTLSTAVLPQMSSPQLNKDMTVKGFVLLVEAPGRPLWPFLSFRVHTFIVVVVVDGVVVCIVDGVVVCIVLCCA